MTILLIDDEAENGWKQIIENVLFKGELIDIAIDNKTATEKLKVTAYDLIFLDLRFGEQDHLEPDIKKFGGYKILKEQIRNSFFSKNYSTPVLVFTASNKIWNIMEMLEAGADDYYIKEHPDTAYDLDFSRKNYIRLKGNDKNTGVINHLLIIGAKRKNIWNKINLIIESINYKITNNNIKLRIEEKLKIGYGTLFRKTTQLETEKLIFNNEELSYIVFWSILEEISKDSFKNNWIMTGNSEGEMIDNKWILKNDNIFIEDNTYENSGELEGSLTIGLSWENNLYKKKQRILNHSDPEIKYYRGKINLSLQIYAIMILGKEIPDLKAKNLFEPLNDYRNKIDFIHSSVSTIFSRTLSNNRDNITAFDKCNEILKFIIVLLN